MRKSALDYILVGLIIALTGFEVIYRAGFLFHMGVLLCISIYFFWNKGDFKPDAFLIISIFVLPLVLQAFKFHIYLQSFKSITFLIVNLLICYLIIEIVKERFNSTFVNIIYFLALFSFIFYPTQFYLPLQEYIKSTLGSFINPLGSADIPEGYKSKTLIFFTYIHNYGSEWLQQDVLPRNSGAFWEPGLFAVFLNIALIINTFINEKLLFSKKNIVFIIAIITTFSTSGFIVLFLIIISYFILHDNLIKIVVSLPIIAAIVYFSITYVWAMDFMSKKIEENIVSSSERRSSRFGAALYHFRELKKFPLGGVYLKLEDEEKNLIPTDKEVSPNGLTRVFLNNGIPFAIIYYFLFYRGLKRWLLYNNKSSTLLHWFFFIIFLLLAFSQDITTRLFYEMVLFFSLCFRSQQSVNFQNESIK